MEIVQLQAGRVHLPAQHPRAGTDYPLLAYLIRHPSGAILVDTGAGPGHAAIDELYSPETVDLTKALADAGSHIDDVTTVINTHLHFDHVGGNRLFPGRTFIAQGLEHAAAQRPRYTVTEWIDFPEADWQLVAGDTDVAPHVWVLATPSHTVGHQSVVVEHGDRVEVIAGQALHNCSEFSAEESPETDDPKRFIAAARRIKALQPDRVWFSHDADPWVP